jgi:hypothetical protein
LKNQKKKGQTCTLTRRERKIGRRKKKWPLEINHWTTTDTLCTGRKIMWQRFQWHSGRPFSDKRWRCTHHRNSADATNASVRVFHALTTFQNLILKINVKLLKSPLITPQTIIKKNQCEVPKHPCMHKSYFILYTGKDVFYWFSSLYKVKNTLGQQV